MRRHQRTPSGRLLECWWPLLLSRRNFVSKTIKFFLLVVFCGTIILNVLFLAETSKRSHDNSENGGRHPRNLRQHVSEKKKIEYVGMECYLHQTQKNLLRISKYSLKLMPMALFSKQALQQSFGIYIAILILIHACNSTSVF